jgi:hypothetical protein
MIFKYECIDCLVRFVAQVELVFLFADLTLNFSLVEFDEFELSNISEFVVLVEQGGFGIVL